MNKRLPPAQNEWIDRKKPIKFSFEGIEYFGFEGDTISSALWANGVRVLGRSFKYHRARGVLSLANHDVNVLVTDGADTNIRADVTLVIHGMQLKAVNTAGGVLRDKKSWLDTFSAFLPVGFYYKAFHSPRKLFPFWEKIIRKSAGLGEVNFNYPRLLKRKTYAYCDMLIVGSGVAGLTAAIHAAKSGVKVVLVDENAKLGGSLNDDAEQMPLLKKLLEELSKLSNITTLSAAYAGGYYADHFVPIICQSGMIKMRAKAVIVTSGAFEQPIVFRNNDLPGVMLSSAATRLVHRYRIKPFENGVIFTANSQGYRAALSLLQAGISIKALVDLRKAPNEPLSESFKAANVPIYTGHCVLEAVSNPQKMGVSAALICPYDEVSATPDAQKLTSIACDGIAMSAGWAPAAALLYQAGTRMKYDQATHQFISESLPAGVFAAGKVNGVFDIEQRTADGKHAANEALRFLLKAQPSLHTVERSGDSPSHPYPIVPHPKAKNFVDFDEDIALKDFINAAQEGFDNIELMKRFTTVGMGPSQGKHSNMNAIRILARIRDLPIEKVGSTTARPFFHPVPLGHLAGRSFQPYRQTALHTWHENVGAVFTQVGLWMRPAYYPTTEHVKTGLSKSEIITKEVNAVRQHAGLIDVSTLGKVEIHGTDSALFLERFYTGSFSSIKLNETRYILALDESGVMLDDGIVARFSETEFYITTTTSNAALVYREMQRWLQIWQLKVTLINVTSAYAAMNLAGPNAGKIITHLCQNQFDVSALAANAAIEVSIDTLPVKIIRVSFVSDLGYELHLPSIHAMRLWTALIEAGKTLNNIVIPFGMEAQRLLRLEMGHFILGHDTDGLTNPFEAATDFALKMHKPFFIGQRSLQIIHKKALSKKLVHFTLKIADQVRQLQECNLVIDQGEIAGRITSIAYSPTHQKAIGLAYVAIHLSTVGTAFFVRSDAGELIGAIVTDKTFT